MIGKTDSRWLFLEPQPVHAELNMYCSGLCGMLILPCHTPTSPYLLAALFVKPESIVCEDYYKRSP